MTCPLSPSHWRADLRTDSDPPDSEIQVPGTLRKCSLWNEVWGVARESGGGPPPTKGMRDTDSQHQDWSWGRCERAPAQEEWEIPVHVVRTASE